MPAALQMLNTLRRAIDLVLATPGRTGHWIRLPETARELLVAGDLHGHVENFREIFRAADLAAKPNRHLVLQEMIHGPFTYPSGGEKSHQLVDLFAALKCQFPNQVHYLPGNHELAQLTGRPVGKADQALNDLFASGVGTAYGQAAGDIYRAYCDLFKVCPLGIRTANRVYLSHSLPAAKYLENFTISLLEQEEYPPQEYQPGGGVYATVWGRDLSEANVRNFLKIVDADLLVTGHIPSDQGYTIPNPVQITLDAAERPAGYLLFPTQTPLTHADLVAKLVVL